MRYTILLFCLTIVAVGFLFWFQRSSGVKAAWFDDSFTYRNAVPISSHTASENNVFVSVTLDSSANFQADCGDLRWTDYGGKQLPYYIVSGCGGASTVVHVFLQGFPAGAQTLYYYYGNANASNGFSSTDFATAASSYAVGTIGSQEKTVAPVAYWDFDEGTGTITYDRMKGGNNGTITNALWQTGDQCVSGSCLYFDGNGDFVDTGDGSLLNVSGSGLTFSAWIRPTAWPGSGSYPGIISKVNSSNPYGGYQINLDADSGNRITVAANISGTWRFVKTNATYTTNKWYYVVGIYDGINLSIYVNGKLDNSANYVGSVQTVSANLFLGKNGGYTAYYQGFIDEPKIYNYARTAAQVKADYDAKSASLAKGASAVLGPQSLDSLNKGLVGYWKMDESSWNGTSGEVKDASGNGNNGTSAGGATTAVGKFGNGGSFDGTNDYVNVPSSTSLNPTTAFAVGTWYKSGNTTTPGVSDVLISKWSSTTVGYELSIRFSGKTLCANIGGDQTVICGTTNVKDQQWHHLMAVYNGSDFRVFVDGKQENITTSPAVPGSSSTDLALGQRPSNYYWAGTLDESRIYNRALSPVEVQQLYNFAPGPVAHYKFDDGTGSSVSDFSGNGNTGSWNGTGEFWSNGKFGKSGSFNASDRYVSIADSSNLLSVGSGNRTLSAWIKTTATSNEIIYSASSGSSQEYIYVLANGKIRYNIKDDSANEIAGGVFDSTRTVNDGNWHFVTTIWDTTNNKSYIYIDGTLDASTTSGASSVGNSATTGTKNIGRSLSGVSYFLGQIDDFKIYNYARTPSQISDDMKGTGALISNLGGSNRKGAVVGWWDFDEGAGTVAHDRSGNGNNGTLTGMASPATAASGWTNSGKIGKGLFFDGSNDHVLVSDSSSLDITGDLTLSAWIKTSDSGNAAVVGKWGSSNLSYWLGFVGNSLRVYVSGDGTTSIYRGKSNSTFNDGSWHQVVGIYKTSQQILLYVDGKPVGLDESSGTIPTSLYSGSSSLQIGRDAASGDAITLTGSIDEVKIYNFALSDQEIKADFLDGKATSFGSFGTNSNYEKNSQNQLYCVPGSTDSCAPPVGEWNFDEGSGSSVSDTSGNANTGTWSGSGSRWSNGKFGKGGVFNGSDDYVDLGNPASLNLNNNFTISAWVKTNSVNVSAGIVSWGEQATGKRRALLLWNGGSGTNYYAYNSGYGAAANIGGTTNIADGKWHYLVATTDSSNYASIYVDGVRQNSGSVTYNSYSYGGVNIGRTQLPEYFNGSIDGVKIFNYARTPAQIAWDYNKGKPVAQYDFDECQGSILHDLSGNGNDGSITIAGTGTQTSVGTCQASGTTAWYSGRTGKYSGSLNFDGTDDYVSVTDNSAFNLSQGSISLWVKPYQYNLAADFIARSTPGSSNNQYWSIFTYGGKVRAYVADGSSNKQIVGNSSFVSGEWKHVIVTFDNNTIKIFTNGVLDASAAVGFTPGNSAASTLRIAGNNGGMATYFKGQIDDVRIYNYPLTATQVKLLYNQNSGVRFGPQTGSP